MQARVFFYQAVVGRSKVKIVLDAVIPCVQLTADVVGRVDVYRALVIVVTEHEGNTYHFQQQKQKEVEIPPEENNEITHLDKSIGSGTTLPAIPELPEIIALRKDIYRCV